MYLIRKINPLAEQHRFYPIGNPAVGLFHSLEEATRRKEQLEVETLKDIGITNHYEYWDVDCTRELEELNDFLNEKYDIQILKPKRNKECHSIDDVIHCSMFPEYFTDKDYLLVQNIMGRYHYKIMEVERTSKFVILYNNDLIAWLNEELRIEFKLYDTFEEAEKVFHTELIRAYNKYKGTFDLVGIIKKEEFTKETEMLLKQFPEIYYGNEAHVTNQRFTSQVNLDELENGVYKLLSLLKSVGRVLYEIRIIK